MSFIHGTDERVIVAKNLESYRRKLKEDLDGMRAELMRYIWGVKGMPAETRAEELQKKGDAIYDLDCRLAAVDHLIRCGSM